MLGMIDRINKSVCVVHLLWQNAHSLHLLVLLIQFVSAGLNLIFETKELNVAVV